MLIDDPENINTKPVTLGAIIDEDESVDDWLPSYQIRVKKDTSKIMMMCKFFAYNLPCQFETRFGKCRSIHSKEVVNAHSYTEECKTSEVKPTIKEIKKFLDPTSKLEEIEMAVMQELLVKWPLPPKG